MSNVKWQESVESRRERPPPFGEAEFHSEPGRFPGPCRKFGLIDQKGAHLAEMTLCAIPFASGDPLLTP